MTQKNKPLIRASKKKQSFKKIHEPSYCHWIRTRHLIRKDTQR